LFIITSAKQGDYRLVLIWFVVISASRIFHKILDQFIDGERFTNFTLLQGTVNYVLNVVRQNWGSVSPSCILHLKQAETAEGIQAECCCHFS